MFEFYIGQFAIVIQVRFFKHLFKTIPEFGVYKKPTFLCSFVGFLSVSLENFSLMRTLQVNGFKIRPMLGTSGR